MGEEWYEELVGMKKDVVVGTHKDTVTLLILGIVFGLLGNPTAFLEVGPL